MICCAAPNLALLLSLVRGRRHQDVEDGMGAMSTTNGDTCNVAKSSPKVRFFFFVINVLQEYALGMLANLVMS